MRISNNDKLIAPSEMPIILPSLNALRVFECAARHLSFTQAALELSVTQSAISHQLKGLEQWLGFPLFERRGQRLSLTPGGKVYAGTLSAVFTRIEQATQDLMTTGSHHTLNLRGYGTFFVRWLIPIISDFQGKEGTIWCVRRSRRTTVRSYAFASGCWLKAPGPGRLRRCSTRRDW